MGFTAVGILMGLGFYLIIGALVAAVNYVVIKYAVKHALRELEQEKRI